MTSDGSKNSKQTTQLIEKLSLDLTPTASSHRVKVYLAKWLAVVSSVFVVSWFIYPKRADLALKWFDSHFVAESALWFFISLAAAGVVIKSAFPSQLRRQHLQFAYLPILSLATLLLSRISLADLGGEWNGEMSLRRGWCGLIIVGSTVAISALGMMWAKNQAPARMSLTGAWIAISAGAFSSFIIQFICAHESVMHITLWHVLPVVLLTSFAAYTAQKLLRW